MRVLIVDDDNDIRRLHTLFVVQLGHDVRAAGSGAEACLIAAQWPPDYVLLDIAMPDQDGYQTAPQLRPLLAPGGVICAVSATEDDAPRREQAGIDLHRQKPITKSTIESLFAQLSSRDGD